MNEADDNFGKKLKTAFDDSVDSLDATTLSKLNRSRHAALARLDGPNYRWSRWLPATGVAAAVLLSVMVLQSPQNLDGIADAVSVSDMEILLGEDSIEMLEDLEFYSWIDIAETDSDVG